MVKILKIFYEQLVTVHNFVLIYLHIHQTIIISSLYSHILVKIHLVRSALRGLTHTHTLSHPLWMPSSASCLNNALANKLLSRMMKLRCLFSTRKQHIYWDCKKLDGLYYLGVPGEYWFRSTWLKCLAIISIIINHWVYLKCYT